MVGRAMHDYSMLSDGDSVVAAVSGGVDSLLLAQLLVNWQKKAPIDYTVQAVHVDMAPDGTLPGRVALQVSKQVEAMGISCHILPADKPAPPFDDVITHSTQDVCFHCARSRRRQLFAFVRQHGGTVVALGHHQDDIIETFFLNLTSAGNISTMRPKQELFSGRLSLIRPLAYLAKKDIIEMASRLRVVSVESQCPLSGKTRRQDMRDILNSIYSKLPGSRSHIFAALGNVRTDYLLNQSVNKNENKS